MHSDHTRAETALKALDQLRRERDLRHQNQHLAVGPQRGSDDLQIHLGLAAAGHAIQQMRGEAPQRGPDGLDDARLSGREHDLAGPRLDRHGRSRERLRDGPAVLGQCPQQRRLESGELVGGGAVALREPGEQLASFRRPLGSGTLELGAPGGGDRPYFDGRQGGLTRPEAGRQRRRHDLAERMVIVIGGPPQKIEGHGIEYGTRVQYLDCMLQLGGVDR